MRPDGTGALNVTAGAPVPRGFLGQPSWHPDGEHIVFQAENARSQHTRYNHMAWGIDNDLLLRQITRSNAEGDPRLRYLVCDFDWDRAGTRIALLVASVAGPVPVASEIWMVTFPEPQ